jgi:hypothetical protein
MKEIIRKMMAQKVKKSEPSTDQEYNNVEVSLKKTKQYLAESVFLIQDFKLVSLRINTGWQKH